MEGVWRMGVWSVCMCVEVIVSSTVKMPYGYN